MSGLDARDWYVMLHIGAALTFSAVFVWCHPNYFAVWCGFVGSVGGIFQWLVMRDSKVPDALPRNPPADPA